eukprot:NODE_483_length_6934_cov_0.583175.p2 type:complete len:143 gc:universal NODE_483_length_6934_cov_0.583175:4494-4066(-)
MISCCFDGLPVYLFNPLLRTYSHPSLNITFQVLFSYFLINLSFPKCSNKFPNLCHSYNLLIILEFLFTGLFTKILILYGSLYHSFITMSGKDSNLFLDTVSLKNNDLDAFLEDSCCDTSSLVIIFFLPRNGLNASRDSSSRF